MSSTYNIEFQPQLVEEAVLRAIANHRDKGLFWKERDRLYENTNLEDRERAFQDFHKNWLNRLGLVNPLQQALTLWPILTASTNRCLLIKARTKKDVGAELYVASKELEWNERARRSIVIQLTPELLSQSQQFLDFLRHELLHIVDMLDPNFGYEPNFPKTDAGPTYDHFLQSRYGMLWDIIIDGRLCQSDWLPPSVREKHWTIFKRAFRGPEEKLAETFSSFFDQNSHTHRELMDFAQHPEKWLTGDTTQASSKGRCAICHFPTFQLINPSELRPDLVSKIQKYFPAWNGTEPVCRQCVDLYEARLA